MIAKLGLPSGQTCTRVHPVRPAVGMLSNFCQASKQVLFVFYRYLCCKLAPQMAADNQLSTACALQHVLMNEDSTMDSSAFVESVPGSLGRHFWTEHIVLPDLPCLEPARWGHNVSIRRTTA